MRVVLPIAVSAACAGAPCADDAPWRAEPLPFDVPADLRPPSAGACPTMTAGSQVIVSAGLERRVLVVLPEQPVGAPVVLAWHGNDRAPEDFAVDIDAVELAARTGAIVVLPETGAGGYFMAWAIPPNDPEPDAVLFDDLLACLDATWTIDRARVSTLGFSAGGVWSAWLLGHRAEYLAAGVVLSGGTDFDLPFGGCINPYEAPAWPLAALVAHGGDGDVAFLDFPTMALRFARKLRRDEGTAVLCDHGRGHTIPEDPAAWAGDFVAAHTFGTESPYARGRGVLDDLPGDCGR